MYRRVRTLMVVIASIACLMGLGLGLQRRAESFQELASYHDQTATHLYLVVGGVCTDGMSTQGEIDQVIASRGEGAWQAYEAAKSHERLAEKYAAAAKRPWMPAGADPPAPEGVYPSFEFDPAVELNEGFDTTGGFR